MTLDQELLRRRDREIRSDAADLLAHLEAGAKKAGLTPVPWQVDGLGLTGQAPDEATHQAWTAHLGSRAREPLTCYRQPPPHHRTRWVRHLSTEDLIAAPSSGRGVHVRLSADIEPDV